MAREKELGRGRVPDMSETEPFFRVWKCETLQLKGVLSVSKANTSTVTRATSHPTLMTDGIDADRLEFSNSKYILTQYSAHFILD